MNPLPDEYVAARSNLLDALEALESHRDSLVLVGAQAVYLHTGSSELKVPIFTTDGDLAVDTGALSDYPELSHVLRQAGFSLGNDPGHWVSRRDVAIDLMVVPSQSGREKRNARGAHIPFHERNVARIAPGLEPALIDNFLMSVSDFEPLPRRTIQVRVAGPAALLTAKAIKIRERVGQATHQPDRLKPKDALDAFRILQETEVPDLVQGFSLHARDTNAKSVSNEALDFFREHGCTPNGVLPRLASDAAAGQKSVSVSFAHLATNLLEALGR